MKVLFSVLFSAAMIAMLCGGCGSSSSSSDACADEPIMQDKYCCYVAKTCSAGTPSDDNTTKEQCLTLLSTREPTEGEVACAKSQADQGSGGCCMEAQSCLN